VKVVSHSGINATKDRPRIEELRKKRKNVDADVIDARWHILLMKRSCVESVRFSSGISLMIDASSEERKVDARVGVGGENLARCKQV
jgi:hypothetical protein